MAELNLLPSKEFEITLNSGEIIKGKFGTWAAKRFCDKLGLSISDFIQLQSGDTLSFEHLCQTILCAVEYKSRKDKKGFAYSDVDACEWIEELGGLGSEKYTKLVNHASSELPADGAADDEKKSL